MGRGQTNRKWLARTPVIPLMPAKTGVVMAASHGPVRPECSDHRAVTSAEKSPSAKQVVFSVFLDAVHECEFVDGQANRLYRLL